MRSALPFVLTVSGILFTSSCGSTVNNNQGISDTTAPGINLLVTRAGQPNLEVQARTIPPPNPVGNFGNPVPASRLDFSVLATATDAESGIRTIKLSMTRTVCFVTSSGGVSQAYSGTVTRKEATYTDRSNAPTQASLGDTGIFDNRMPRNLADENLLAWTNANGVRNVGVGVSTKWNVEATNFAGMTTYSNVIFVVAGNTSCVTDP